MDNDTFWNLVNPLQKRLFRFAFSILKNKEDAQDGLHDVLEKLWHQSNKLKMEQRIDSYAMKVMKNHCIDLLRKRRQFVELAEESGYVNPHLGVEAQDMIDLIQERINQLPITQRMIIELKDAQGYSYEEISNIMDMPINNLRVYLSRARKFVIKQLEDE